MAVAYVVFRGIADISSVLVIVGLALFIAVGLNPILEFLVNRGFSRGVAVVIVTFGFVLVIAGFVLAAVPPLSHEIQTLVTNYPRYKANSRPERDGRAGWRSSSTSRATSRGRRSSRSPSGEYSVRARYFSHSEWRRSASWP